MVAVGTEAFGRPAQDLRGPPGPVECNPGYLRRPNSRNVTGVLASLRLVAAVPFTWTDEAMSTGVPFIDEQHKELLVRYNRFHEALLAGRGRDQLLQVLGFLISYANTHFPQEEELMDLHSCPAAEPNRIAHRELLKTLERVAIGLRTGGTTITAAVEVESKVANWLQTHICTVDVKLRTTPASSYFREKGD